MWLDFNNSAFPRILSFLQTKTYDCINNCLPGVSKYAASLLNPSLKSLHAPSLLASNNMPIHCLMVVPPPPRHCLTISMLSVPDCPFFFYHVVLRNKSPRDANAWRVPPSCSPTPDHTNTNLFYQCTVAISYFNCFPNFGFGTKAHTVHVFNQIFLSVRCVGFHSLDRDRQ